MMLSGLIFIGETEIFEPKYYCLLTCRIDDGLYQYISFAEAVSIL